MLQELSAGSCSASCCSLARGTTGQGGTSGLLCPGVGLPVLGNEEGLERLCRTDRMGFGACVEKLRDLGCWTFCRGGPGLILQLLQGFFQRVTESARLEKILEIIKLNLFPGTTLSP